MFGTSQLKLIFSSKILSNLKQRFVVFYSKLVFCAQVYCSTAFDVNITKHKPFILNSLLTKINSTKSIESKYIFATVKSNRHLTLLLWNLHKKIIETHSFCACLCLSAANKLGVDAIFVYTKHGYMASLLSRNRPDPPIFAFTDDESTRMALNLQWGVVPLLVDLSDDAESNISKSVQLMKSKGLINKGDVVLVVSDVAPTRSTPMALQSIQVKTII